MTPATMILEDGTRITTTHFAVLLPDPDDLLGRLTERIACAPRIRDLTASARAAPVMRSDDPRVVNCPLCKDSAVYKDTMARYRNMGKPKQ